MTLTHDPHRSAPLMGTVPGLNVLVSVGGDATVLALRGEFDNATMPAFVNVISRVIADHHGTVVIDLAQITSIDATALRALDRANQFLRCHDRQLVLRPPSGLALWGLEPFGLSALTEPSEVWHRQNGRSSHPARVRGTRPTIRPHLSPIA